MKHIGIKAMVVMGLCCSASLAGPLNIEQVSENAKWVAHVDVAALLKSGIAQFVLQEAEKKNSFVEGLTKFREGLGFDPLRDVRGLTLYGTVFGDESGVVVADATTDQNKLLNLLMANPSYKAHEYGDYAVHEWTDQPKEGAPAAAAAALKTHFGTFYDQNTIVVATSMDLLKTAIDVLGGKAKNLAKSEALAILPKPAAGAFLTAAAEGVKPPANAKPQQAALMKNVRDIALQLGEVEGETFLSVTAVVEAPQKAVRLRQVLQGLIALVQMQMAERKDLPVLGEKVQVGGEGSTVQVDAAVPTKSLVEMIQFLAERKKARAIRKPAADR